MQSMSVNTANSKPALIRVILMVGILFISFPTSMGRMLWDILPILLLSTENQETLVRKSRGNLRRWR